MQKKFSFGMGTIFSLIVVYFIYLYSKDKNWALLAFVTKWYLIIFVGITLISIAFILMMFLFSLVMFLVAMYRMRHHKKKRKTNYVDIEYNLKE